MALHLTRKQISASYADNRGRPTRTDQKLDNQVKSTLEDAADAQDEFNLDLSTVTQGLNDANVLIQDNITNLGLAVGDISTLQSWQTGAITDIAAAAGAASDASQAALDASGQATAAAGAAQDAADVAAQAASDALNALGVANSAVADIANFSASSIGSAGTYTGTPDASGDLTINHGYVDVTSGTYPPALKYCTAFPSGGNYCHIQLISVDPSNFVVRLFDAAGAILTAGSFSVLWRVAGA